MGWHSWTVEHPIRVSNLVQTYILMQSGCGLIGWEAVPTERFFWCFFHCNASCSANFLRASRLCRLRSSIASISHARDLVVWMISGIVRYVVQMSIGNCAAEQLPYSSNLQVRLSISSMALLLHPSTFLDHFTLAVYRDLRYLNSPNRLVLEGYIAAERRLRLVERLEFWGWCLIGR